jgi:hypothetical protein
MRRCATPTTSLPTKNPEGLNPKDKADSSLRSASPKNGTRRMRAAPLGMTMLGGVSDGFHPGDAALEMLVHFFR